MNIQDVKEFCRAFPGATETLSSEPANILAFKVRDKKFAYFKTSSPERWRFSIRVTPERFLELTDQPGIKPARYMHRFHWVTIVKTEAMDGDYLKKLITWSYNKAVSSLPARVRKELIA